MTGNEELLEMKTWANFLDRVNNLAVKSYEAARVDIPPNFIALDVIQLNEEDKTCSFELVLLSKLNKDYRYYIMIAWNASDKVYFVKKELMPFGVDIKDLVEGRPPLKTIHHVQLFLVHVYECCMAFHSRQWQIHELKELRRKHHWNIKTFYSPSLLFLRVEFHPLKDASDEVDRDKNVVIILHYDPDRIRPSKLEFELQGFSDQDSELLKEQFSVLKKYSLQDGFEWSLIKTEEDTDERDAEPIVPREKARSNNKRSKSPVAGPSGTQRRQQHSPSSLTSVSS